MLDVLFVALFLAIPVAIWLITRSLVWTSTRLILAFGLGGNAAQTAITWGMSLTVRSLQGLALAVMVAVLVLAVLRRRSETGRPLPLRRQVWGIVVPALVLGAFLLVMRLLAPETASPMAGLGYLVNHPLAEDNAKWLHLTSQLATGESISFNGYAGGPLLVLMSVVAALISVLSLVLLGGVNEVAVAVNTLLFTQFLLIALVPFALAPFAEGSWRAGGKRRTVPVPLMWVAALVLFSVSAVVTSYGHLSFQFVLIIVTLWSAVFLMPGRDGFARLVMTLAIATTASVWVPLNILGLVLVLGLLVWALWRRRWLAAGLTALTLAVSWDALLSSALYLLGLDGLMAGADAGGEGGGASDIASAASSEVSLPPQVLAATHLFEAPGGTEIVQPIIAVLALASVLFVVARHPQVTLRSSSWKGLMPVAPIVVLGLYTLLISVGDGVVTGSAPHYGGHKLALAWTVMALASTLPLAIAYLEPHVAGMTVLRWLAIGAVAMLLMLDTILPRAVSALSPKLWPGVDASSPAYWVPAEVKDKAEQPISSLPVACLFTPPQSPEPSALPLGQQAYSCTRLLVGLNGLEGQVGTLPAWLGTDWLSNQRTWESYYPSLVDTTTKLSGRTVILMDPEYGVAGLAPWTEILRLNAPVTNP